MLKDGSNGARGVQGLEKDPLASVPLEPAGLLEKTRYQSCLATLADEQEEQLRAVIAAIASTAAKRGVLVKPFFDDASRDCNSVRRVNHVTPHQFKQVRGPPSLRPFPLVILSGCGPPSLHVLLSGCGSSCMWSFLSAILPRCATDAQGPVRRWRRASGCVYVAAHGGHLECV